MTREAELRWRCRRGMKELDVLLERYMARGWPEADAAERAAFERLLAMQDPDLYALLSGQQSAGDREIGRVVDAIRRAARP